jgi:hypothetical protein
LEGLLELRVTLFFGGLGEVEEVELFGGAPAAEAGGEAALRQEVGDGDLFGDVERVMEVGADDGGAEADAPGLAGEVEGEEEGRGEVALVDVGVVFGEEEVIDAKMVGPADEIGDFGEDVGGGAVGGAFEVVGEGDLHGLLLDWRCAVRPGSDNDPWRRHLYRTVV